MDRWLKMSRSCSLEVSHEKLPTSAKTNRFWNTDDFELAEPIVNYTSIYVAQVNKEQNVSGLIVITPTVNPIEPTIRMLQQNGALAVVLAYDGICK